MALVADTERGRRPGPQGRFAPPALPPGLVHRARLDSELTRATAGPLTLLAAPAGAGKTTLVAAWVAAGEAPGPVAWVCFDGVPPRRRTAWALIADALAAAAPALDGIAIPGHGAIEPALAELRERLDRLDEPVVLVLDDFHEVGTAAFAADLDHLLVRPPLGLRLVLLSRHDPLMRLQRLRLSGTMTELRMRDLAMTEAEAAALLERGGAPLSPHDATTLWRRTEGWAAGLRLATLTLRDHPDPAAFVEAFAGDDAAVADYLVDEVLARRPDAERDFLLRTSIVDEVSGELADALTGGEDGDEVLHRLAHEGAMVTAIEEPRGFFRFHPLLRDLLRVRLRHAHRDELSELHRRAATWLAAHDVRTALRHAGEAGDGALGARIAADGWISAYVAGGAPELHALIDELPADAITRDPELALACATARAEEGDAAHATAALAAAEAAATLVPPERRTQFNATLGITIMRTARLHGDLAAALARARTLIDDEELRAVPLHGLRALALANLGIAELWVGDSADATRDLEAALGVADESDVRYVAALAQAHLAILDGLAGRLRLAVGRAEKAIELVETHGWERSSAAAAAYLVRGSIELAWDDLDDAERSLASAADALAGAQERALRAGVALSRARLLATRGEHDGALATLRLAQLELGDELPIGIHDQFVALEGTLVHVLGERAEAAALLEGRLAERDSADVRVALARLHLATGRPDDAIAVLAPVRSLPATVSTRVQGLAIEAVARDALLDHDGAAATLERALDLAEPRGLRRPLLAVGSPLRPVLHRQVRHETAHRALVADVLDALDRARDGGAQPDTPLLDPLSDRELTVLRYLPTMMSNTEIASELFVSVNTVKTHLKQIYRKLDVTSRREAVRRARELQLLAPGRG